MDSMESLSSQELKNLEKLLGFKRKPREAAAVAESGYSKCVANCNCTSKCGH